MFLSQESAMTYDVNGIRVRKANGTNITNYIVDGSTVLRQSWNTGTNTYVADYIYTEAGTPLAFALSTNGGDYVYYFYETNIQGDVIAIYNSNWTKLAAFYYDAWGKFTEGVFNTTGYTSAVRQGSLFRYRGYIYDIETSLAQNKQMNGGVVRSDLSGKELVKPMKSTKGVTPNPNEWQIDHIIPKSLGGTNSFSNAQVLSREENRIKWYK